MRWKNEASLCPRRNVEQFLLVRHRLCHLAINNGISCEYGFRLWWLSTWSSKSTFVVDQASSDLCKICSFSRHCPSSLYLLTRSVFFLSTIDSATSDHAMEKELLYFLLCWGFNNYNTHKDYYYCNYSLVYIAGNGYSFRGNASCHTLFGSDWPPRLRN